MVARAELIEPAREWRYFCDLSRAFGGALLFSIPLLMTEEMWRHGVALDRSRLLAFLLASLPVLFGLAYYAGFSARRGLRNNLLDTFAALAVGMATSGCLLWLFGVFDGGSSPREVAGQLSVQAVPGAIGALLARRQLSQGAAEGDEDQASYLGELFLMAAGALFLGLNLAPTNEMVAIAYDATPLQGLAIIAVSVALLHLIVFNVGFAGQEEQGHPMGAFLHYTLPGYVIALAASLAMLWVFGRTEDHAASAIVMAAVVLGFPAALGAAAARLLV